MSSRPGDSGSKSATTSVGSTHTGTVAIRVSEVTASGHPNWQLNDHCIDATGKSESSPGAISSSWDVGVKWGVKKLHDDFDLSHMSGIDTLAEFKTLYRERSIPKAGDTDTLSVSGVCSYCVGGTVKTPHLRVVEYFLRTPVFYAFGTFDFNYYGGVTQRVTGMRARWPVPAKSINLWSFGDIIAVRGELADDINNGGLLEYVAAWIIGQLNQNQGG